ncbi:hypothetical protein C2S53_016350 [Perilla frutescens var. hirtella]|uniref:Plant bHLH transcription factor ACT-like domain-containing protein n=1 Tax=Perilla frutescens var. hirtella TaxID=608512 RepID=A0AAD4P7K2_PERFH|nr:hypothetical protein C2S53_016350 [Perilla frutescens var. hirtella]
MHRRIALRRKLQILRSLTKSKSVKKNSIITDAFIYIYKLKLQVEAIKKEYQHLINHIQEVKVENMGKGYLMVRVRCKKGEQVLASVVEVFEELNMNVVEASISCDHFFGMEAIIKPHHIIDATILNRALLMLVQMHTRNSTSYI